MKPIYRKIGRKLAVIDIYEIDAKNTLVTRVNVPSEYRNKGIGTGMLNELIRNADEEKVVLQIDPSPYPDSEMSKQELIDFYKKFGFVFIAEDKYMIREPKV